MRHTDERLEAGSAQAVHVQSRCARRHARAERNVTAEVCRIARRLLDVADADGVDELGRDVGSSERGLESDKGGEWGSHGGGCGQRSVWRCRALRWAI